MVTTLEIIEQQEKRLHRQCMTIAFMSIMLCLVSVLSITLQNHYQPQITGLRTQLSRTQKQLKRASEDRARQTKRIAELTGNGR